MSFRGTLILWTVHMPVGPEKRSSWDLSELCIGRDRRSLFHICPKIPSLRFRSMSSAQLFLLGHVDIVDQPQPACSFAASF